MASKETDTGIQVNEELPPIIIPPMLAAMMKNMGVEPDIFVRFAHGIKVALERFNYACDEIAEIRTELAQLREAQDARLKKSEELN
jgi:hypothetical protein